MNRFLKNKIQASKFLILLKETKKNYEFFKMKNYKL